MRILAFTTSYPRSRDDDASIFVHRLYRALSGSAEITVVAPIDHGDERSEERDGVRIRWIRYLPFFRQRLVYGAGLLPNLKQYPWRAFELPLLVLRLAAFARSHRTEFDVVHANWILPGCAAWAAKMLGGRPYVVTLRGSDTMLFKITPIRWISGIALRSAAVVTTVSEPMKAETIAAFPWISERIQCIENGVELSNDPGTVLPDLPARFLVAVGAVIPRKRLEIAIEILSTPVLEPYSLVICGTAEERGYMAELQALAIRLGAESRVRFMGAVPPDQIAGILKRASAFLACSSYEGRPNAVLEALSAGTPVLASDIPAHRAILTDGETGLIFDAEKPADAAVRLARLLADDGARAALAARGSVSVASATWKVAAMRYLELFAKASAPFR